MKWNTEGKIGKDENIHRREKKFSRVDSNGRGALVGKGKKKGEREQGLRLKLILFLNAIRAFNQEFFLPYQGQG